MCRERVESRYGRHGIRQENEICCECRVVDGKVQDGTQGYGRRGKFMRVLHGTEVGHDQRGTGRAIGCNLFLGL